MDSRLKFVFAVSLFLQLLDFSKGNRVGVTYGRNHRMLNSFETTDNKFHKNPFETTDNKFHKLDLPTLQSFETTDNKFHKLDLSTLQSQPYNPEFPKKRTNPNGSNWCIASTKAQKSDLQNSLDWVCGPGQADCSAIQPGQRCFEPNELFSHASFAFNNYYKKHGSTTEACNFGGTGTLVSTDPSYGKCIYD